VLRLHISGSLNDDIASVREDAVETIYTVSSGPEPYTVVVMGSGEKLQVKEKVGEIEDAIHEARKAASETQP
jgi:uncharacterized protein YlzI (FlbEa/FlbD family)